MTADDLSAPLGQNKTRKRRVGAAFGIPHILTGLLGLSLAGFAGWAMIVDDPFGGEPIAVVPTGFQAADGAGKAGDKTANPDGGIPNRYDGPAGETPPAAPALPPGTKTVTIIDGTSGKRQDVLIPATPDGKNADGKTAEPKAADPATDAKSASPDDRLSEPSRHGALPKIAQDGARPADAFARAVKGIPGKPNAPRIAILVNGLGISAAGTSEALKKLPGPITFAFAPYGDIERHVLRARGDGHEILLQVPMEPFDYPDNDPGPQTLLTSLDAAQNVDRLHWLMTRLQGYVGITNFMGARFTATEQALSPVLREAAKRGLIYVDDGASPRSLASQIAGANNLPFAKADLTIDAVPTPADIDKALAKLEAIARDRGTAVGAAGALPVSIERIARWAKSAESRGILLVPITAAVAKAKSS